jgi:hypothetical protein
MEVNIIEERGYETALYGLSLSYKDRAIPIYEWWTDERKSKIKKTAKALAKKGGGHNKFLESIVVWLDVEAPRNFWSEFDTYRVGMTKQSESTMHTIRKRPLTLEDFHTTGGKDQYIVGKTLTDINKSREYMSVEEIKNSLPDSYLQRRQICTNYKVLQNIVWQRENHKLPTWQLFCNRLKQSLAHPEYIW